MVKVMFLCAGNPCRSQMAQGFAKAIGKGLIESCSVVMKPGANVDPFAIKVMNEIDIDISSYRSKVLDRELIQTMDIVVTLCGDMDKNCPARKRADMRSIHVPVRDPSVIEGSEEEKLAAFRKAREQIRAQVGLLLTRIIGL